MLIHPFVPSARATSPCDTTKSAQTVSLPNGSKTADREHLCQIFLKKPSFSWTGLFTKLGPQIRLPPVPNFGVNSGKWRISRFPGSQAQGLFLHAPDQASWHTQATEQSKLHPGSLARRRARQPITPLTVSGRIAPWCVYDSWSDSLNASTHASQAILALWRRKCVRLNDWLMINLRNSCKSYRTIVRPFAGSRRCLHP
jgi:hypothetical protein